jgi:hypothetical protein
MKYFAAFLLRDAPDAGRTARAIGLCAGLALIALGSAAYAAPQLTPGAYRIDVNGKVRELCVDEIANGELSAKGWQSRLADQGVRCTLHDVKNTKQTASWTGLCSAPGMGKVFNTRHQVSVKINPDRSFELQTELSGDLQAKIPVRGERLAEGNGACTSQHDTFRPWQ